MRGNRRYIMSRANNRNRPAASASENHGHGTAASVDTQFLSKLITSGDTGFIDDLVGTTSSLSNASGTTSSKSRSRSRDRNLQRGGKRWPFILLGMLLAYIILILWQTHQTSHWWRSYTIDLKSSQQATIDQPLYGDSRVAGGLRSSYSDTASNGLSSSYSHTKSKYDYNTNLEHQATGSKLDDVSSSKFYKIPNWQGSQRDSVVDSNQQIPYEENSMGGQQTALRRGMAQRAKYENVQTGDSTESYLTKSHATNTGGNHYNMDDGANTMNLLQPTTHSTSVTVDNTNFKNYQNKYQNNNANLAPTTNGMTYSGSNVANNDFANKALYTKSKSEISPPSLFEENQSSVFSSRFDGIEEPQGTVVTV
mmetsp:Transcript_6212/g.9549  ORF Transcript_6212/g.9549 Transcript_6212/m.9549 type:complete len:366 (+) Transcript_6212:74-1171(+)